MADSSLFSSIDVNKTGLPTQLAFTQPTLQTGVDDYGNTVTWRRPSEVATSGVQPVYYTDVNGNQSVDYYQAATPTIVNGVPAYAQYDSSGKLTGYQGAANVRGSNSLGESVIGYWDASGAAKPVPVSGGGGLFDSLTNVVSGVGNYITENPLQAAALAAGAYGLAGGLGGAAGLESVTAEQLAAASATEDPIAALNAIKGWTTADTAYLASIGGMTPEILAAANANNAYLAGGEQAAGVATPAGGAAAASGLTGALSSLTPAQTAALAKAGIGVAGLLGGGAALGGLLGGGGGGTVTLPAQDRSGVSSGSAQYTPEYYAAIQSKYNQMMPQQPRDVTTELKNWYETKYVPSVTTTQNKVA